MGRGREAGCRLFLEVFGRESKQPMGAAARKVWGGAFRSPAEATKYNLRLHPTKLMLLVSTSSVYLDILVLVENNFIFLSFI